MSETPVSGAWQDLDESWFAALEGNSRIYGLARRVPKGDGRVAYEVFIPETDSWVATPEGPGYFTGEGGVTDAVPITAGRAKTIEAELIAALPADD